MLDIELKHVHIKQILNTQSRIYTLWGRYKTCQAVAKLIAPSTSHKTRAGQNYSLANEISKAGWKVNYPCILISTIAREIYNTFLQSSRDNCENREKRGRLYYENTCHISGIIHLMDNLGIKMNIKPEECYVDSLIRTPNFIFFITEKEMIKVKRVEHLSS